jgi:hypothetical protein
MSGSQGSPAWNGSQIGIAVLVGAAVLLSSVNARGVNGGLASCSYVSVADERPPD